MRDRREDHELRAQIERILREADNRRVRRLKVALWITVAGLAIACLVGIPLSWVTLKHSDRIAHNQAAIERNFDALRRVDLRQCARVQTQREEVNRGHAIIYLVLSQSASRERALAHAIGTRPDARTHRVSAASLQRDADAVRYTNLTDCEAAERNPDRYRPPRPEPFRSQQVASFVVMHGRGPDQKMVPRAPR